VKKFHGPGGEIRNPGQASRCVFCKEIFIGNTEKTSCKLTTKGV